MIPLRRLCCVVLLVPFLQAADHYDLTILGFHRFAWGIGRRSISLIDTLKDSLRINYIPTRPTPCTDKDIDDAILQILHHPDKTPGTVAFFVDILTYKEEQLYALTPESTIKLAFVALEMTQAPRQWVYALNNYFDAAVVPDPWLIPVLEKSGVTVPIFVVPEMCYLNVFLEKPSQEKSDGPFVFGITAQATRNKNYDLLLEAFAAEFGNAEDVILKIHNSLKKNVDTLTAKVSQLGLSNVQIHSGQLSWEEYIAHMASLDCYILVSKGEGYSITPREALALGKPCILSNNTAHKTLCDSGFVRPVASTIRVKHDGEHYNEAVGYTFMCERKEVQEALRDVYDRYDVYVDKARKGRKWVARYDAPNLKKRYLSLIKPQKVLYGSKNEVTDEYLMTSSKVLYTKYLEVV